MKLAQNAVQYSGNNNNNNIDDEEFDDDDDNDNVGKTWNNGATWKSRVWAYGRINLPLILK